jgi:phage shock protein A
MRGLQRLTSAARGSLWLLRATGLRQHFSGVESRLDEIDSRVLHLASQSGTAMHLADNIQRLERQIRDVMADVSAQHNTTVRVAESVQRLGKHIVDVAAHNLTNGRLSEQLQKLEKQLPEIATHSLNGTLTEQFRKLEERLHTVIAGGSGNGALSEPLQKLERQLADLAAIQSELTEKFQKVEKQLEGLTSPGMTGERWEKLERCLAELGPEGRRQQEQARWLAAQDLRAYERRVYSRGGEDGIIQEILHRIGVEARYFVELGVQSATESNCARLVLQENWLGLFIESDDLKFQQLTESYQASWGVRCIRATASSRNIEHLLAENGVPFNLDVLAIAVNGNDYWLWNALNRWRPRLIVIEYNGSYPPAQKWVMQENLDHKWDGTSYYGASLASLTALGRKKGYTLVGADSCGRTAFFVRDDLAGAEKFLDAVVHYHYSSPEQGPFLGGIPPASGPHVEI